MGSIWVLIIEIALLVMKLIGVSAQKRKNFLDWVAKKSADSSSSINMKDSWKKIHADLIKKLKEKKAG